jgi:hypothetical protein
MNAWIDFYYIPYIKYSISSLQHIKKLEVRFLIFLEKSIFNSVTAQKFYYLYSISLKSIFDIFYLFAISGCTLWKSRSSSSYKIAAFSCPPQGSKVFVIHGLRIPKRLTIQNVSSASFLSQHFLLFFWLMN